MSESSDTSSRRGVALVAEAFEAIGFAFREQATSDFGIDALVEVRDGPVGTGRLLAVQIKAGTSYFGEPAPNGWWLRTDARHAEYWHRHVLPVILVLVDIEGRGVHWSAASRAAAKPTGRGIKFLIPTAQRLDASSQGALIALAGAGPSRKASGHERFPPAIVHPAEIPSSFCGRVSERQQLTRWWRGSGPSVLSLIAMGGMGKSALAGFWMQSDVLGRHSGTPKRRLNAQARTCAVPESDRPDGVLWWSFYQPQSESTNNFAQWVGWALEVVSGPQSASDAAAPVADRARKLLALLETGRYLLVLDGFERALRLYNAVTAAYLDDGTELGVSDSLRRCTHPVASEFLRRACLLERSRVLLTSRCHPAELDDVVGAVRIDLGSLTPEDACRMFRQAGVAGSGTDIATVCERAGRHPLALKLLLGVIKSPGRFRDDVRAVLGASVAVDPRYKRFRQQVFGIAYQSLSDGGRALLSNMAVFTQPASFEAILSVCPCGTDEEALVAAVKALEDRGFIYYDQVPALFDMHPLVREYAFEMLSDVERRSASAQAFSYGSGQLERNPGTPALAHSIEVFRHAIGAGLVAPAHDVYFRRLHPLVHFKYGMYDVDATLAGELVAAADLHPGALGTVDFAFTLTRHSTALLLSGHTEAALVEALRAQDVVRDTVSWEEQAPRMAFYVAAAEARLGRLDQATDRLRGCIGAFAARGESFQEANACITAAWVLGYRSRFEEAHTQLDRANAILLTPGFAVHWRFLVCYQRVRLALWADDATAAARSAQACQALALEGGIEADRLRAEWASCAVDVRGGAQLPTWRQLGERLSALADGCRWGGYIDLIPDVQATWADWFHRCGEQESARIHAETAADVSRSAGFRLKQAEATELLSMLSEARGDVHNALAYASSALTLAVCEGESEGLRRVAESTSIRIGRLSPHKQQWNLS